MVCIQLQFNTFLDLGFPGQDDLHLAATRKQRPHAGTGCVGFLQGQACLADARFGGVGKAKNRPWALTILSQKLRSASLCVGVKSKRTKLEQSQYRVLPSIFSLFLLELVAPKTIG